MHCPQPQNWCIILWLFNEIHQPMTYYINQQGSRILEWSQHQLGVDHSSSGGGAWWKSPSKNEKASVSLLVMESKIPCALVIGNSSFCLMQWTYGPTLPLSIVLMHITMYYDVSWSNSDGMCGDVISMAIMLNHRSTAVFIGRRSGSAIWLLELDRVCYQSQKFGMGLLYCLTDANICLIVRIIQIPSCKLLGKFPNSLEFGV